MDPRLHPRKTMDQTVSAARITNDPISRGYRTYYGESEVKEIDMSGAFGYEETEDLDGKETYEFLVKDMGMEPDEAKDRTKQQGKDPSGKKDKKSEDSIKNDEESPSPSISPAMIKSRLKDGLKSIYNKSLISQNSLKKTTDSFKPAKVSFNNKDSSEL